MIKLLKNIVAHRTHCFAIFGAKSVMNTGIKKIAVIGPECTGKSELSEFLAAHFDTAWVPEYARTYIDNLPRPYEQSDLLSIALGQLNLEDSMATKANRVLICDTNLYVIKVWSMFKYGSVHPEILREIATRPYDLYLLTNVDIPWVADPQREHPDKREQLFEIYLNEMQGQPVPYKIISGDRETRKLSAIKAIENLKTLVG